MAELSLTDRLLALWEHLGLDAAHVATQVPSDIAGFAAAHPSRIAGLALCVPVRLDPTPFAALADRLVMIAGSSGLTAEVTTRAHQRLPAARRLVLPDYAAPGWADVTAERGEEIAAALRSLPVCAAVTAQSRTGTCAGLTYAIQGSGPPLVLLPFFLAPSQWTPILPDLTRDFTVITLGGRHLGGVALLEDRARCATYTALVRQLLDMIAPAPGATILDVGCGSGALDRMLARHLAPRTTIVATDVNPFLLREAEALAAEDGLGETLRFQPANAESLPFADATFDAAFSVTVLEECDADRALAELRRVVRPGGRVGVIVRSIDLPQWWNLKLPDAVRRIAELPPQSVGPRGVADASLYPRMRAAGFRDLVCFPALVTFDQPDGPIWRYREDHVLSQLSPEETQVWRAAADAARAQGLLVMANPLHCAVGTV